MTIRPTVLQRMLRTAPWSSNPLMRGSDRWKAAARIIGAVLVLVAIPLAIQAGAARYDQSLGRARANAAAGTVVYATMTELPVVVGQDAASPHQWSARVAWSRGGRMYSTMVEVSPAARRGDRLPVRLGGDGRVIDDLSPSDFAWADGVSAGMKVFGSVAVGVAIAMAGMNVFLERRQRAAWGREWRVLSRTVQRG